jgi:hypothetical protein
MRAVNFNRDERYHDKQNVIRLVRTQERCALRGDPGNFVGDPSLALPTLGPESPGSALSEPEFVGRIAPAPLRRISQLVGTVDRAWYAS